MKLNKVMNNLSETNKGYGSDDYYDYFTSLYGFGKKPEKTQEPNTPAVVEKYKKNSKKIKTEYAKYQELLTKIKVVDKRLENDPENPHLKENRQKLVVDIAGMEDKIENMINRVNAFYKKPADIDILRNAGIYIDELDDLLTLDEQQLIFGDTMERISEITNLEEAKKISQGNVNQAIKLAQKKTGDPVIDNIANQNAKNAVADKTQADIKARNSNVTDPTTGERFNESIDLSSKMMTKNISKNHKMSQDHTKDADKIATKNLSAKHSDMLYNGESGDALKYMITGEVNNSNTSVLEILKYMEQNPEVSLIVKKIKSLLAKSERKELDNKEHAELKVMKNKFRSAFAAAKTSYTNRFN